MTPRVLVAGVGNVFMGDDGFGVAVANRLATEPLGERVEVRDVGIRGIHLAYELLDGYDALIVVDAASRGGEPGTVFVLEVDHDTQHGEPLRGDAHSMDVMTMLAFARRLGASIPAIFVVGCEPARVTEGIGLSGPMTDAIEVAVARIRDLVRAIPVPTKEGS